MFIRLFRRTNPQSLIEEASVAQRDGNLTRAEQLYRKALDRDPRSAQATINLARILTSTQRRPDALALLAKSELTNVAEPDLLDQVSATLLDCGDAAAAEATCRRWMVQEPNRALPYHRLAESLVAQRQPAPARAILTEALTRCPSSDTFEIRLLLASLLLKLGDVTDAATLAAALADADDSRFDVLRLAVRCEIACGDVARAVARAQSYAQRHPHHSDAHACLCDALLASGQTQSARDCAQHAVALDPSSAYGNLILARSEFKIGQRDQARERLEHLIAEHPEHADAHYAFAQLLIKESANDAEFHLELCLRYDPLHADAMNLLVRLLNDRGQRKPAIERAESLRVAGVFHRDLLTVLAVLYHDAGQYEKSVALLRQVLDRLPTSVDTMSQLGLGLRALGSFDEARTVLQHALELAPTHHSARCNLALVKADYGNVQEAIADLTREIELHPGDVLVRWDRSLMLLSAGNFAEGWDDYELRWHAPRADVLPTNYPAWQGQTLPNGILLVLGEQGIGDEIMFASCFPDVRGRAARIIIACGSKLVGLFRRSFGNFADVMPRADLKEQLDALALPPDAHARIIQLASGSLPRLFRRDAAAFPAHHGFLQGDPAKIAKWRDELAPYSNKLRIGLSWRGGAAATRQSQRSLDIPELAQLTQFPNAHFINLQHNATADEVAALKRDHGIDLIHFDAALADYDETAALTCAVDVVVTVQTALAHLAGALGQRVLVMLPFSPEWRYLRTGSTWPWYPSATLLRQTAPGVWHDVIDDVHSKLNSLQP